MHRRIPWRATGAAPRCRSREGRVLPSQPPIRPDAPDIPPDLQVAGRPAALDGLVLDGAALARTDFSGRSAANARLSGCRLSHVDFASSTLANAAIEDAVIAGGSWANVRTTGLRLRRVTFGGVRMTGADLSSASIRDVAFTNCRVDLASFRFARLERVVFDRCKLDEIDFNGAHLQSVLFADCTITRAVWAESTLARCEMRGTDIAGAVNPERLRGMRMPWPDALNSVGELAAAAGIVIVE